MQADRLALQERHQQLLAQFGKVDLQSTKTKNHTDRELGVAVQLDVPEQWHGQQRAEPVRGDVDGGRCVVDVCQSLCGVAFSTFDGGVPGVLHWSAVKDDV